MPAPPGAAVTFDVPANPGELCSTGAVDGQGIVAADAEPASNPLKRWFEFSAPYGSHVGSFESPEIFAQGKGFIGLYASGTAQPQAISVALWNSGGAIDTAPIPVGTAGSVVLGRSLGGGVISLSADASSLTARKHDAEAAEIASTTLPGAFAPRAVAEDASGAILALTASGTAIAGVWIDLAKNSAGQPFPVGNATSAGARPLLGGGVAVQLDGAWAGVMVPGEASLRPLPAWLTAAADPVPVRSGKAYALVPRTGNSVGIASAQGRSCGSVTFPGVSSVSVGSDGSVVGSMGASGCTKLVWRNLLR